MLTYIFNILILIISISPQFNNLSLFKNEINSSFNNKFNNTKDLEVLLFTSFNPSYFISILKLLKTSPDYLKIFLKKSLIKIF